MSEHTPVLLDEVLNYLAPKPGQNFIDATFGRGGHARALAERILPDGKLMIIDCDEEAIQRASEIGGNIQAMHGNFSNIKNIISHVFINLPINGVLIDCGISSAQLGDPVRGLSFLREGPLDMRMDRTQIMTAHEIVNRWSETKLAALIHELGEEPFAKRIAAAIVAARRSKPIATTIELAAVIAPHIRRRWKC